MSIRPLGGTLTGVALALLLSLSLSLRTSAACGPGDLSDYCLDQNGVGILDLDYATAQTLKFNPNFSNKSLNITVWFYSIGTHHLEHLFHTLDFF